MRVGKQRHAWSCCGKTCVKIGAGADACSAGLVGPCTRRHHRATDCTDWQGPKGNAPWQGQGERRQKGARASISVWCAMNSCRYLWFEVVRCASEGAETVSTKHTCRSDYTCGWLGVVVWWCCGVWWCGVVWCCVLYGVVWCVVCCVVQCGVVCGVVWCGAVWCSVVQCCVV